MSWFNPSRDQVRQFFVSVWQKYQQQAPLEVMEHRMLQVILQHPEYQATLTETSLDQDYFPEQGITNPFLHMSLHLAIIEQLALDQPTGIVAAYQKLQQRLDEHAAQHVLLECLAESLWQAQRIRQPLDPAGYWQRVQQRLENTR